jgi:DNA-binding transcriptional ArsR family regulator
MTSAHSSRFHFFTDDEIETIPDPEWLVEGVLPLGSFGVLYSPPGLGKTFLALDMGRSIAAGVPWQGRDVKKGPVLYIAAEGRSGLKPRRRAWNQEHSRDKCPGMFYLPEPVQLTTNDDLEALMIGIDALGRKPILIVIDTLARCFVGRDENHALDMGLLVAAVDRLRAATGAAVLLIHHSGKPRSGNRQSKERGSSALGGAADVMMSLVAQKHGLALKCEKQKEAEPFEPISFRLKTVTIGDGLESCVVVSDAIEAEPALDEKHESALDVLATFRGASTTTGEWRKATGIPERTFYRIVDDLMEAGAIDRKPEGKNVRYTLNLKWLERREKRLTTATAKSVTVQ